MSFLEFLVLLTVGTLTYLAFYMRSDRSTRSAATLGMLAG